MKDTTTTAGVRRKGLTKAETRAATEATKEDRMIMALAVNKVAVLEVVTEAVKTTMALAVNKVVVMEVVTEVVKMTMALDVSKEALEAANMSSSRAMEVEETCRKVAGKCSYLQSLISANLNQVLTRGSYGGGGGYGADDYDPRGAAHHAQQHAGDSGDSHMFSNVLNHLGQNRQHFGNQQIDEQGSMPSHPDQRFEC